MNRFWAISRLDRPSAASWATRRSPGVSESSPLRTSRRGPVGRLGRLGRLGFGALGERLEQGGEGVDDLGRGRPCSVPPADGKGDSAAAIEIEDAAAVAA